MNAMGQAERRLGGRYKILQQLGQGGFGDTYLAEDTHRFQELCILKEFNPQVEGKLALDKAQALFEREASILYQLNHPQIPRFRELLREGTRLFLVQDYVEGPTYQELLDRRRAYSGSFSEAEVTQLLAQLLPVLQYLHSLGIVHRDISPGNLIQRNADGRPILIDFGGVKQLVVNVRHQLGVPQPYQSTTGEITRLGTVGYAPATQLESGQVGPADDLYALGVTALVLLTGKEPEALYDDRQSRWVGLDQIDLFPPLQRVLTRLVANSPADRFQAAGPVMAALNLTPSELNLTSRGPGYAANNWSASMPVRMQPVTPPPPLTFPTPTVAVAPAAPPVTAAAYHPALAPAPPTRAVPTRRSSRGCFPALAGLMVLTAVAGGLWWWLEPLALFSRFGTEAVSPSGGDAANPAFSAAEQVRKQELRDRALALEVDQAYLTRLTDQIFYEQNPNRQGTQLTDQPQDAELRAKWDVIAATNLDLLEANLSPAARAKLGRYSPTDIDRWQGQINALFVSSKALNDLTNARFSQLFPGRPSGGFVETPVDQIWFALAQDQVAALESGTTLTEIKFESGALSQQFEATLPSGHGQVYIVNLTEGQLMRLNLQAPPQTTRLSLYVPVPTDALPYLLSSSQDNTWAGEMPQAGYYEIVVVSQANDAITSRLTVATDTVIDDIINKPAPPAKDN
ncbi:MAG: protein kinase [Nodosilinea sp.]